MKEILENIWNWIDTYSFTLVAIVMIIVFIIIAVCAISVMVIANKKTIKETKTKLPRDKKGRFVKRTIKKGEK